MAELPEFDLLDHMATLSDRLQNEGHLANQYANKTGKGDAREESLLEIINSKLPPRFVASKGEIIDSNGKRTPEFDIIISIRSGTPRYFSIANRVVIPCEDIVAVIEVKSMWSEEALKTFSESVQKLNQLERHFSPTQQYVDLSKRFDDKVLKSLTERPIRCDQKVATVSIIPGIFFSYDGPQKTETALSHILSVDSIPHNIVSLHCLNKYQALLTDGNWIINDKHPRLVLYFLMHAIFHLVEHSQWDTDIRADSARYISHFLDVADANIRKQN